MARHQHNSYRVPEYNSMHSISRFASSHRSRVENAIIIIIIMILCNFKFTTIIAYCWQYVDDVSRDVLRAMATPFCEPSNHKQSHNRCMRRNVNANRHLLYLLSAIVYCPNNKVITFWFFFATELFSSRVCLFETVKLKM